MAIQDAVNFAEAQVESVGYIRDTDVWCVADMVDWIKKTEPYVKDLEDQLAAINSQPAKTSTPTT